MEPQQLAAKVSQLEARVATLEDEGKIVKGEVKQILTEIRSAILVRDNPFEGAAVGAPQTVVTPVRPEPVAKVELVMPQAAPEPVHAEPARPAAPPAPAHAVQPAPHDEYSAYQRDDAAAPKEPVMLRPQTPAQPDQPRWTLLAIAGLSAWAEEAVRRLGPLRVEILLDLCQAAGHISADARTALSRIVELDLPEPQDAPSTNETVVMLRQLDALINDEDDGVRELRRGAA